MRAPIAKALFVALFGLVITIHTHMDSKLLYALTPNVRPKAVVAMDSFIDWTLLSHFGRPTTVCFLTVLTGVGTCLAFRRQWLQQNPAPSNLIE